MFDVRLGTAAKLLLPLPLIPLLPIGTVAYVVVVIAALSGSARAARVAGALVQMSAVAGGTLAVLLGADAVKRLVHPYNAGLYGELNDLVTGAFGLMLAATGLGCAALMWWFGARLIDELNLPATVARFFGRASLVLGVLVLAVVAFATVGPTSPPKPPPPPPFNDAPTAFLLSPAIEARVLLPQGATFTQSQSPSFLGIKKALHSSVDITWHDRFIGGITAVIPGDCPPLAPEWTRVPLQGAAGVTGVEGTLCTGTIRLDVTSYDARFRPGMIESLEVRRHGP